MERGRDQAEKHWYDSVADCKGMIVSSGRWRAQSSRDTVAVDIAGGRSASKPAIVQAGTERRMCRSDGILRGCRGQHLIFSCAVGGPVAYGAKTGAGQSTLCNHEKLL